MLPICAWQCFRQMGTDESEPGWLHSNYLLGMAAAVEVTHSSEDKDSLFSLDL